MIYKITIDDRLKELNKDMTIEFEVVEEMRFNDFGEALDYTVNYLGGSVADYISIHARELDNANM